MIYQRLSAVLWSEDGRTREEIAELVGVSTRQVGKWFRIFRNKGSSPKHVGNFSLRKGGKPLWLSLIRDSRRLLDQEADQGSQQRLTPLSGPVNELEES